MGQVASRPELEIETVIAAAMESGGCREILDALPIAIYVTDARGRLTHFNKAAVAMSGRTPEVGSDKWWDTWKLYHPDGRPMGHDECPMAVALGKGRAVCGEQAIAERADGTRFWFEVNPAPLFDSEGNVVGSAYVLLDVTERKRAEGVESENQKALADDLQAIQLLQQVSMHLAGVEDCRALYDCIMDAAVAIMRSDCSSMQMYYPERGQRGELRLLAFRGFSPEAATFWEWVRADSGCTCGQALRTGKRSIAGDIETCDFMAGTADRVTYLQGGMLSAQTTPLFSRGGRLVGMISTHWKRPHQPSERDLRLFDVLARQAADWIERLQAEEALRRKEQDLRDFVENASIAMHWVGPDGIILWANRTELAMLGYAENEYVGHHISEFYVDEKVIEDILRRLDNRETLHEYEARLRCKDGSVREVIISSNVLCEHGKFIHTRCFTRDVTQRKQSEQGLARLAAIVESSDDAIISKDLAGIINSWNIGAERLFGYTAQEAIGQPVTMLMPPERVNEEPGILRRIRQGERIEHYETVRRRKDGTHFDISLTVSPLRDADGRIVGASKVGRDITARKQLERERASMLANEEALRKDAEAATQAKDRFLAVLSHELRTPLSPVVMTVAAMETDPELPFEMRENLAMIRRNIELEVRLIDDLLDLSRVTSGKMRLQVQPTSVHAVLRQAIENCANETSVKKLGVRVDLLAARDMVKADPARLQQVFWNLIRNASKFTPAGGEIIIRTSSTDQAVLIEVRDTGMGIRPEHLPKIFEAFEQGDIKTSKQFGGLGLGLAICKAVVDMHGGSITAHSDGAGKGATFTVKLSTTSVSTVSHSVAQPPGQNSLSGNARILLVEDHPDTANVLSRLLRGSGYVVTVAGSVAAALKLAGANSFDVVVSDLGLPDGTGYELMRQIRDRYGIKGIALSGYGMEEDQRQSREAGFIEHVVKPINVKHLEDVIRRVAASQISG